jgi:hypothetical protein
MANKPFSGLPNTICSEHWVWLVVKRVLEPVAPLHEDQAAIFLLKIVIDKKKIKWI